MYRVREASIDDVSKLQELAQLMLFINLPADAHELKTKCDLSEKAFSGKVRKLADAHYLFVLEDFQSKKIIGTSSIIAQHGTVREPHMYFEISKKTHYSRTTNIKIEHDVMKFKFDTDGPTEIAGLVMDPDYRKSTDKLGRFVSFVRFLYMAMWPDRFRKKVLAELLPPFLANGSSALWEAVGKQFTHLSYHEADRLSRQNKEFVTSLFPHGEIYIDLLPGNVRDVIGEVGPETKAVKYMLEKIGFQYHSQVDPFDGGPHYWANFKDILPIQTAVKGKAVPTYFNTQPRSYGIIGYQGQKFYAIQDHFYFRDGMVYVSHEGLRKLGCPEEAMVYATAYP